MSHSSRFCTLISLILIICVLCLISCVSTPDQQSSKPIETQSQQQESKSEASVDKKTDVNNELVDNSTTKSIVESDTVVDDNNTTISESSSENSLDQTFTEPSVVTGQTSSVLITSGQTNEVIPVITPVEVYRNLTEQYTITPLSVPAPAINGQAFKKDYKICVLKTDTNEPANEVSLTVSIPSSKTDGVYEYSEVEIVTDIDGVASLSCPVPTFSANTQISFYLTPDFSNTTESDTTKIKQIIEEYSLKLPYQVKTNLVSKGGSIALLDYDKKGKAINDNSISSSALLTSLMRLGFSRIGNSDFSEQIASNKIDAMYKQATELFGTNVSYLIYGTIKYDGNVIKNDDGYTVNLIADVSCYNMLTKKIIYNIVLPISSTEKTEWEALNNARVKLLGPQLAELLLYGM